MAQAPCRACRANQHRWCYRRDRTLGVRFKRAVRYNRYARYRLTPREARARLKWPAASGTSTRPQKATTDLLQQAC